MQQFLGRERKPMRLRDINGAITLVNLNPRQRLTELGVCDVVSGVFWEDRGIPSEEVERAGSSPSEQSA